MNTEELMAEIARVNASGLNDSVIVGSTDVKALYPSLEINFTIEVVCDVFEASDVVVEGVDYEEVGLYISLCRGDPSARPYSRLSDANVEERSETDYNCEWYSSQEARSFPIVDTSG